MKKTGGNNIEEGGVPVEITAQNIPVTEPMAFDPDRYRPLLDDECGGLTDEQANEILFALWEIMQGFVYLGWGVDSINYVLPELAAIASEGEATALESENNKVAKQFENVTAGRGTEEKES